MFFSFLVPKISTTTSSTISQCQMLNDPMTLSEEDQWSDSRRMPWPALLTLEPGPRPAHHVQVQVLHFLLSRRARC